MNTKENLNEPLGSYEITESSMAAPTWTLTLYPEYLQLEDPDGDPYEIGRTQLPERVQTLDHPPFARRLVSVKLPSKKPIFKLTPDTFAALREWIGPPTAADLVVSLKRRFAWVVPLGVLFVLTSIPVGDLDWEPVSLGLGVGLLLTGIMARLVPHRIYFAIDSLWFALLALNSGWLLSQEWSWWRLGLLVLQLLLAMSGWREYRRFAPVSTMPQEDDDYRAGDSGVGER